MTNLEFLQHLKAEPNLGRYILILPSKKMLTKKGTVRRKWLHFFFSEEDGNFTSVPQTGACVEACITVHVPDVGIFYLMSYNEDFDSWRKYIEEIANLQDTLFAEIDNQNVVISNGKIISIMDCKICEYGYEH